ncbi:ran-specific GTPase-activating protein [Anoplophora glabripennis]|nr:ran-specific GTPase-activating protein [Anoplophora glabripennis]
MSELIELSPEKERKQSESSDTEYDPQFKPIITLPEIEIITNEENESELLKIRAKLYRFDSVIEPPEWKERGTGELKILRHNENNSVRVVMRRDKTLKVCANHFITPWMELKPSAGSDKAFVYTVLVDFADEKPKSECLAVKFGTVDNANLFKCKFEEAKHIVATECDLYNGKGDKENENNISSEEEEEEDADLSKDKVKSTECAEVTQKISELKVTSDETK